MVVVEDETSQNFFPFEIHFLFSRYGKFNFEIFGVHFNPISEKSSQGKSVFSHMHDLFFLIT